MNLNFLNLKIKTRIYAEKIVGTKGKTLKVVTATESLPSKTMENLENAPEIHHFPVELGTFRIKMSFCWFFVFVLCFLLFFVSTGAVFRLS